MASALTLVLTTAAATVIATPSPGLAAQTIGTWPHTGEQWAELTWPTAQTLDSADVYFFHDNGGARLPASYRIQYWNGSTYADVAASGAYPRGRDSDNRVAFSPVSTTRLRVVLQSGAGSVGLLEVKAFGP